MFIQQREILSRILQAYPLCLSGIHGIAHWARVLENGLRLAGQTGGEPNVLILFALLHDSQRQNDGHDPDHGPRAADFAARLRGDCFELDDHSFWLLQEACAGHTLRQTHSDPTVQTCFDADRLDLSRVGIRPDPARLCTAAARDRKMIRWASERADRDWIPALVADEWGIEELSGGSLLP